MATPVGHGLAGLSFFLLAAKTFQRRQATLLSLVVLFALLPDFDFIPGILIGQPAAYHHGISHSLGFGIGAALLVAWIAGRRWWPARIGLLFLLLFGAYASHLLFDFFGTDSRPPYGIPLFWPLSSANHLSPIPLFTGVRHVRSTEGHLLEWIEGVLSWHNVFSVGREVLLLMPFVLAFWWLGRMRADRIGTPEYPVRYAETAKEADETVS